MTLALLVLAMTAVTVIDSQRLYALLVVVAIVGMGRALYLLDATRVATALLPMWWWAYCATHPGMPWAQRRRPSERARFGLRRVA